MAEGGAVGRTSSSATLGSRLATRPGARPGASQGASQQIRRARSIRGRFAVGLLLFALSALGIADSVRANTFPNGGSDAFESTMTIFIVGLADDPVELKGPVVVMRSQPTGAPCEIQAELVMMDLTGTHPILGDLRLRLDPAQSSAGKITSLGKGCTFPADSFFDVFVQVELLSPPFNGEVLFNKDPIRVVNENLKVIPPFFDSYTHPFAGVEVFFQSNPDKAVATIGGGSNHRVEQLPTFSVAAGGPTSIQAGELHDPGNPPIAGLTLAGLGLLAGDDIDAVSYGLDSFGMLESYESQPIIAFSVDPLAVGSPNSGVNRESLNGEAEGDEFISYYNGSNIEAVDEQSWVLQEGAPGDDLDAITNEATSYADLPPADMVPDRPVFFSLAPSSPTLTSLGVDEAALLVSLGGATTVFAEREALGLQAGDDVDALCLMKSALPSPLLRVGSGSSPTGPARGAARFDSALFSLAPGSPTLGTIGAGPGDILFTDFSASRPNLSGTPPAVYAPASQIGLLAADNLNALKCLLEVGVFDLWGKPIEDGFWLVDLGGTDEIAAWNGSYAGQYDFWAIENPGVDFHGPYVHPSSEVAQLPLPFPQLDPAMVNFVGSPGDNCGYPHVHQDFEMHTDPDPPACGHGVFVPHEGPGIGIPDCADLEQIAGSLVDAFEEMGSAHPSFAAGYHELTQHSYPPPFLGGPGGVGVAGGGGPPEPGMAVIVVGMGPYNMDTTLAGAAGLVVSAVRSSLDVPLVVPEPAALLGATSALLALGGLRAVRGRAGRRERRRS